MAVKYYLGTKKDKEEFLQRMERLFDHMVLTDRVIITTEEWTGKIEGPKEGEKFIKYFRPLVPTEFIHHQSYNVFALNSDEFAIIGVKTLETSDKIRKERKDAWRKKELLTEEEIRASWASKEKENAEKGTEGLKTINKVGDSKMEENNGKYLVVYMENRELIFNFYESSEQVVDFLRSVELEQVGETIFVFKAVDGRIAQVRVSLSLVES